MNREKLAGLEKDAQAWPTQNYLTTRFALALLDALLEEGGPPAGRGVSTADLFEGRLSALEARDAALERYGIEVHGSLKALEDRLAAVEVWGVDAAGRYARLAAVRDEWRAGSPARGVVAGEVAKILEAVMGPPDEFATQMRSGQDWVNRFPHEPVKRGATPCPVCGFHLCMGDVDPRACDQRAAARQAHP